jgi:hypothetical protein
MTPTFLLSSVILLSMQAQIPLSTKAAFNIPYSPLLPPKQQVRYYFVIVLF